MPRTAFRSQVSYVKGVVLSLFHFFLNFVFNFFVILERSEESRSSCVIQSEAKNPGFLCHSERAKNR